MNGGVKNRNDEILQLLTFTFTRVYILDFQRRRGEESFIRGEEFK
jgi:hypothetical protein